MGIVGPKRMRSAPGALALFGVLAGLLFSCGEGIRLLPFPVSELTENTSLSSKHGARIGDQKIVHRLEKRQETSPSKPKPHKPWAVENAGSGISGISFTSNSGKTPSYLEARSFSSKFSATALKGRAPPVS